jgi:tRNA(Ile)-lysidine synthase
MTSALHQCVRRTIRRHRLIPEGSRVVVGLSGGSDSVALTFVLRDLAAHGGFEVVGLAHFNHRLRPSASRDEQFCRELAARQNIPFASESADVAAHAAEQRLSLEDGARRLRYEFLGRAAASLGAGIVAVGHTQDDQAETFLMKLMRGASLTGLAGVYPRKGLVVRPLLDVSRAELRTYLGSLGETWVEDETNGNTANPRNRIRHHVLPQLNATLGGSTGPNLARAAATAREDTEWLDEVADGSFSELVVTDADELAIDLAGFALLPRPVARRVLVRALRKMAGCREVRLEHVEAALAVAAGETGGIDVPGGRMEPRGSKLVLIQHGRGPK